MAKVRSLKHIKKEIEKVEASIRKHARGTDVATRKKRVLNVLSKMKASLDDECVGDGPDSFSPIPPTARMTATSMRKTAKKKGASKK
ncbi:MAG TPA: hypothetical protein VFV98_12240 [Vicinamibacterales bacterium]|nr:hypothetical protein [Vicinamibacterales bacterium]